MATATITMVSEATLRSDKETAAQPLIVENQTPDLGTDEFNPRKHLAFKKLPKIYTMKDIGFPDGTGVSPVAVSEPFALFTEEAIHRMRAEVLSKEVLQNCQYSSSIAQCQLRGFASK